MTDHEKRIITVDDPLYREIFGENNGLRFKMDLAMSHGLQSGAAYMYTDEMMAYFIALKTGKITHPQNDEVSK